MNILITGEGGQGVQTLAKIISESAYQQGLAVSYLPHYGVEMRMGISRAYVCISREKLTTPKFSKADILTVMTKRELKDLQAFINEKTVVINALVFEPVLQEYNLSINALNMVVLGILLQEIKSAGLELKQKNTYLLVDKFLSHKKNLAENKQAVKIGLELGKKVYDQSLQGIKTNIFSPVIDQDSRKSHIKYPDLCKGCGLCLLECPTKALSWDAAKKNFIARPIPKVDLTKCIACGICQQICPDAAISVKKK